MEHFIVGLSLNNIVHISKLPYASQNNFENICDIKIVNFPQLQCLAGTYRYNLVNFVKIKQQNAFDDHFIKY